MVNKDKQQHTYFTKQELRDLFTLDDTTFSKTQQQLNSLHSSKRVTDAELDKHIAFLQSLGTFVHT